MLFFFSSVLTWRERERESERERERERVSILRTYWWCKFRFQSLSQQSEEDRETRSAGERSFRSGEAHRSVPTSIERIDRVFPAVYF